MYWNRCRTKKRKTSTRSCHNSTNWTNCAVTRRAKRCCPCWVNSVNSACGVSAFGISCPKCTAAETLCGVRPAVRRWCRRCPKPSKSTASNEPICRRNSTRKFRLCQPNGPLIKKKTRKRNKTYESNHHNLLCMIYYLNDQNEYMEPPFNFSDLIIINTIL